MAATYDVRGIKRGHGGKKEIMIFVRQGDDGDATVNIGHAMDNMLVLMVDSDRINGLPASVKTELLSCFDSDLKDLIETDDYNSESDIT